MGPLRQSKQNFWDYKRDLPSDSMSLAKAILQITSFYNTYGGYILYGFEEIKSEGRIVLRGLSKAKQTVQDIRQKLRDNLKNYTGEAIDIAYAEFRYPSATQIVGLLYIPKRPRSTEPVFFGKDALIQQGQ